MLGLVEIPEHGGAVLATGGAEGSVGGDGDGVDVAGVANVVSLKLAGGKFPDLSRIKVSDGGTQLLCGEKIIARYLSSVLVLGGLMACEQALK